MHNRHSQGAILIAVVLAALLFSCKSNQSENYNLMINGVVHVYRTDSPPADYPGSDFIAVLGPNAQVKVKQVVHKRGYQAVRIKLSDGREGWVFSGENIELSEP